MAFTNITGGEPFIRKDISDIVRELYKKSDRIVVSTNGTIFRLDKKLISKIKKLNIKTWLITCNDDISINFFDEKLIVPSLENKYNEYSIKYIIDIIIASVHLMRGKY